MFRKVPCSLLYRPACLSLAGVSRCCGTMGSRLFRQIEALNVMSRNQEGVCFSEIRALQGAMLAAKNIYQDSDNLDNM